MSLLARILAGVGLLLAALAALAGPASAQPVTVVDSLGRSVTLAAPARRIVLVAGRDLPALALLDRDVVARLVGIGRDFARQSPDTYEAYAKRFARLAGLPALDAGPGGPPAEQTIALAPDLVLLGRAQVGALDVDGANPLLRALGAAGIPVVVIDFHTHPLRDTGPVMRLLGRLLGREREAEAFAAFVEARLATISGRLQGVRDAPSLFLHAHAGAMACCFSPGQGSFNDDIVAAGGRNVAAALLPGATGQIGAETLLGLDPALYVATGGASRAVGAGVRLGAGVDPKTARATLEAVLAAPSLAQLTAVRTGRAHALWQGFSDSPVNVVAVEVLATWLHPDRMRDIDPAATLAEINARFLAVPMEGTYWIGAR